MSTIQQVQHFIGGSWVGEPVRERRNPADPSEVVTVTAVATQDDAAAALAAAAQAQPGWAATPAPLRGAILDRASQILASRAETVARDLTREEGKTLAEAHGEVQRAVDVLRYFGGEGWRPFGRVIPSNTTGTMIYTKREPIGIAVVITPWNFPIAIPAWKIAPALISGNAVVFKPATLTSLSGAHLVRAFVEAGLPDGVLNVVHGRGSRVGAALVGDPRAGAVSFTGSTTVGRDINSSASTRMGRVQLEMGGKNPIIVTAGADIQAAAQVVATSAFALTGQACTAASRVIAPSSIADELVAALCSEAERYRFGNGLDEDVMMGPVVDAQQLETDHRYVQLARQESGEVVVGGDVLDGQFFAPTIVTRVRPEHTIAQQEVFGPVLAVIEIDDFDEAIEVSNAVPFGLTAGICTNSLSIAHRFIDRIQAGVVKVNRPTVGLELNVPFGGIKGSSTGTFREQGAVATEFYTWSKSVYLGLEG